MRYGGEAGGGWEPNSPGPAWGASGTATSNSSQFLLQSPFLDPPSFAHLLCSASSLPLDPPSVMWLTPCSSTERSSGRELTWVPAGS